VSFFSCYRVLFTLPIGTYFYFNNYYRLPVFQSLFFLFLFFSVQNISFNFGLFLRTSISLYLHKYISFLSFRLLGLAVYIYIFFIFHSIAMLSSSPSLPLFFPPLFSLVGWRNLFFCLVFFSPFRWTKPQEGREGRSRRRDITSYIYPVLSGL